MNSNIVHIVSNDKSIRSIVASAAWEFEPNASNREYEDMDQFQASRTPALQGSWEVLVTDQVDQQLPVSKRNLYMPVVAITTRKRSSESDLNQVDFNSNGPVFLGDIKPHLHEAIGTARIFLKLKTNASRMGTLTARERSVVLLAADGVPNKTIAKRMDVSIKTIEKIRRNAYLKLAVKSSAEVASLVTFDRFVGMNNLISMPTLPMG